MDKECNTHGKKDTRPFCFKLLWEEGVSYECVLSVALW